MNVKNIHYAENQSNFNEVQQHLKACDNAFMPPLSSRVELQAYALKIFDNANRFEAWQDVEMVGLIAAYCNDPEKQAAFITSVSVTPSCYGMGIASQLMAQCIRKLKSHSFKRIQLEVATNNLPAIRLYHKFGFSHDRAQGAALTMTLTF